MSGFKHNSEENYIEIIQRLVKTIVVLLVIIVVLLVFVVWDVPSPKKEIPKKEKSATKAPAEQPKADVWTSTDTASIKTEEKET